MTKAEHQRAAEVERPQRAPDGRSQRRFGSDAVVDVLRALDVRYLPMNPGSSFRGLHDSLVNYGGNRSPQILLCVHEEIAISIANGWAKATGRLGAAAVHDLVGLMHASMAIYDSYCDQTPLLILGGSGPADHSLRRPIDWVHSANTQTGLVRDFVVWDAEPITAQGFVDDMVRAAQRAQSVPGGPVYVSLDAGIQEAEAATQVMPDLRLRAPITDLAAPDEAISAAADLLAGAERPVVVAGRVGLDPAASAPLVSLVEALGAAYHDDRNAVVFPTGHPQNCTGDLRVIREADVVLAIDVVDVNRLIKPAGSGRRGDQVSTPTVPKVIDVSCAELNLRSWSNALAAGVDREIHVVASPLRALDQLLRVLPERISSREADRRREKVTQHALDLRDRQRKSLRDHWDDRPISQARLVAELWSAVSDVDHLLCLRNTRSWPEGIWQFAGSGTFLGSSGGGGIGYGPGALIGGALAARDRGQLGVGIIGDGDLLMAPGALWTAAHYRIPAVIVVNNNGSFYNDEPHQVEVARQRGRPIDNSWIGMRLAEPDVDFCALAETYGCIGIGPVQHPEGLAAALKEAVKVGRSGGVSVVDVRTARG